MNLLICSNNSARPGDTAAVVSLLWAAGYSCIADDLPENRDIPGLRLLPPAECDAAADRLVSVGGDGTMLRSAQRAIACQKEIFGVNTGRLGFLCAFDIRRPELITAEALQTLEASPRSVLEVSCSSRPGERWLAVNDLVVSKGALSKTVCLRVSADERQIGAYRGDGVIVATPTGSTAYSLSAGGPVVDPSLDVMLLTPICSHSFFSGSVVLDGSSGIRIEQAERAQNDLYLSVDSFCSFRLPEGSEVFAKRSGRVLKLLVSRSRDFYGILKSRIAEDA